MLIYEFVYKDNANEGNENCFQIAECSLSSAKIVEKFKSRGKILFYFLQNIVKSEEIYSFVYSLYSRNKG